MEIDDFLILDVFCSDFRITFGNEPFPGNRLVFFGSQHRLYSLDQHRLVFFGLQIKTFLKWCKFF